MRFSTQTLRALGDDKVTIIDRCKLVGEELFAHKIFPDFSQEQIALRTKGIQDQVRTETRGIFARALIQRCAHTKFDERNANPFPSLSSIASNEQWTDRTVEIGTKIFGDYFQHLDKGGTRSLHCILIPTSPFLSNNDFWSSLAGIEVTKPAGNGGKNIGNLHEIGHSIFSCSDEGNSTLSEVFADGYAIKAYLELGGEKSDVKAHIEARRLYAFLDKTSPKYHTATTCEDILAKQPFTPPQQSFARVRELQIRVFEDMSGRDVSKFDDDNIRLTIAHEVQTTDANGKITRESLWTIPMGPFDQFYSTHPTNAVMESLDRVLERTKGLSCKTRAEGEAILSAYRSFCPKFG